MARVPPDAVTTEIVRLAPEWARPEARAFCGELEALSRSVPWVQVIHAGRNLIFRHRVADDEVAVKRFPVRGARRLVYRLRTSKAVKAFDNATRLATLGIGTPRPLAAVEVRRERALVASYYCSAFVLSSREARWLKDADVADRVRLLELLGAFVGRLHENGVLHRDLTSGNVLLIPDPARPGAVSFQLVDVNRVRFGRVGVWAGLANLAQLRLRDPGALLAGYCQARGLTASRAEPVYRVRVALRSTAQALKGRTRPWRRRFGM